MKVFRDGVQVDEYPVLCFANGNRINEIRLNAADVHQLWEAARVKPELVTEVLESWVTHFIPGAP